MRDIQRIIHFIHPTSTAVAMKLISFVVPFNVPFKHTSVFLRIGDDNKGQCSSTISKHITCNILILQARFFLIVIFVVHTG